MFNIGNITYSVCFYPKKTKNIFDQELFNMSRLERLFLAGVDTGGVRGYLLTPRTDSWGCGAQ